MGNDNKMGKLAAGRERALPKQQQSRVHLDCNAGLPLSARAAVSEQDGPVPCSEGQSSNDQHVPSLRGHWSKEGDRAAPPTLWGTLRLRRKSGPETI